MAQASLSASWLAPRLAPFMGADGMVASVVVAGVAAGLEAIAE
jgi:hypothetical protein